MISFFDADKLEAFRQEHKIDPYRLKQVQLEIFKNSCLSFDDMTSLPKDLRSLFAEHISIVPFVVTKCQEDDEVVKFLFAMPDDPDNVFETVLMYHYSAHVQDKLNRMTLCISSQVGCSVGCTFCVTGKLGLKKNLSHDAILGQVLFVNNYIKKNRGKKEDGSRWAVRNIVYMGMGEPFLNYPNVKKSVPYLTETKYLGLSRRRVTISTSGVTPIMRQFNNDNLPVSFAFSLHAPNQTLRAELVPFAEKFPLDELMKECDEYARMTGNKVFYEYVLIKNINDTNECAHEMGVLLKHRKAHLNVIPYNQNPAVEFEEPTEKQVRKFQHIVESYGVTVTVRGNMGRKSKGACGQLGREEVEKKLKIK